MVVKVAIKQISVGLHQELSKLFGEDKLRAYRVLTVDLSKVPAKLAEELRASPGVEEMKEEPVQILPKDEKAQGPLTSQEGWNRLNYHVATNGLIQCASNLAAIEHWFKEHPEAKFDKGTVDRVLFLELEQYLLWQPGHPGHAYWLNKMNPLPPPPPKPAPPVKVPKKLLYLPNGEKRLPVPSPPEKLLKASLFQLEDYRRRGGI